jgi:homoprotocatechuate degradation regulator HpaR
MDPPTRAPAEANVLPPDTRRSLPISLLRARESIMAQFRPMLARHDVTEQQWRVLRVLSEGSPLDATDVAERASILAPSLTRIIKAMEDRGFITKGKFADDGRRVQLSITPAGSRFIAEISPERQAIYQDIEDRFGHEDLEKLLAMLDALIESQKR